jgi:cell division protein FtsX
VVVVGASSVAVARTASEVDELSDSSADVEVFMTLEATRQEVRGVQQAVRRSDLVDRYSFLDKQDSLREFRRIFRKDRDLVAAISADDLPVSFKLDLSHRSDRQRAVDVFGRLPGVDKVAAVKTDAEVRRIIANGITACLAPTRTFEVFMNVNATSAQVGAMGAAIEARADVVSFRYLDKAAAYEEFKRIFRKDPDLIKKISASDLPESFRVEAPRDQEAAIRAALGQLPGVEKVASPTAEVCDSLGR